MFNASHMYLISQVKQCVCVLCVRVCVFVCVCVWGGGGVIFQSW